MIFAKKKILVWCDDPPEDPVISIFAGCLANHDRAHSRDGTSRAADVVVLARAQLAMCYYSRWEVNSHHPMRNYGFSLDARKAQSIPHSGK